MKESEILKNAENLYHKNDIDGAINLMLEGKPTLDRGLFHYNLGSLYLKKKALGPARFHLEKAQNEGFSYPMLWKNLDVINQQPQIIDPLKQRDFFSKGQALWMGTSETLFFSFSLLLISISLALYARKIVKNIYVVIGLILFVSMPSVFKMTVGSDYQFAVALKSIRVFEGPSKIYSDIGEVAEGSRVIVSKLSSDWYYIISPKAYQGWASKKDLATY